MIILERIYGPVKDHDQWRCRYNNELYDLLKEPRLSEIITIGRLRWAAHVTRMEENSMPSSLCICNQKDQEKWEDRTPGGEMMWERKQGCWE